MIMLCCEVQARDEETGYHVVTCDALDITTQGRNVFDAVSMVADAVETLLDKKMLFRVTTNTNPYALEHHWPKKATLTFEDHIAIAELILERNK